MHNWIITETLDADAALWWMIRNTDSHKEAELTTFAIFIFATDHVRNMFITLVVLASFFFFFYREEQLEGGETGEKGSTRLIAGWK